MSKAMSDGIDVSLNMVDPCRKQRRRVLELNGVPSYFPK
jgi:hypothetical protein